ncbi:hypothetical protein RBA41_04075 [Massilia sp. CCM 9210]|nr:hypothetical protein [Massilia sp. CCM 9210]MDQ1812475.1 hypothetical protein [Massilia sp. CCM 9210]
MRYEGRYVVGDGSQKLLALCEALPCGFTFRDVAHKSVRDIVLAILVPGHRQPGRERASVLSQYVNLDRSLDNRSRIVKYSLL